MKTRFTLLLSLLFLLTGCAVFSPLQKSKFITLSNLIDAAKYAEAKEIVEDMMEDKTSMRWGRTWYYKGLLCEKAYLDGIKKGDKSLTELYPDQLFLAYGCYRRALTFDTGARMERQVAPRLVVVANELQKMGEKAFNEKRYEESFEAFDRALRVTRISFLPIETDNSLVFNTALAAYESHKLEKAIEYFDRLHKSSYSVNATHLLSESYLQKGDTTRAVNTLLEGVKNFDYHEDLMLLATEILFESGKIEMGFQKLDECIEHKPNSFKFYFAKGLLHQKQNSYQEAIKNYTKAHDLEPQNAVVNVQIATCYYNIGVAIEEDIMHMTSMRRVQKLKAKSDEAFGQAIKWLQPVKDRKDLESETMRSVMELMGLLSTTNGKQP